MKDNEVANPKGRNRQPSMSLQVVRVSCANKLKGSEHRGGGGSAHGVGLFRFDLTNRWQAGGAEGVKAGHDRDRDSADG